MALAKRGLSLRILVVCACVGGLAFVHLGDLSRVMGDPVGSYGLVTDGTEIDANEERALMELARNADLAYERIAAKAMEAELIRLRAQLAARPATS